ncbi:hypothetical protein EUX98_g4952 [Antrodiella citrinella]|uniref:Protein kinase domain-containing protein n=1 Tax=Antrodiella citrinella TaxID=2447956 RepID=A0A4S4MUJ5_9APHY|nr:hypothetical protein EUX98_g4952 [Antrodiella citrinella]
MENRGGGAFADIYRGEYEGKLVAVKRLRIFQITDDSTKDALVNSLYHESLLWRHLSHPHILPFLGIADGLFNESLCMVMPWAEHGNIRDTIRNCKGGRGVDYLFVWVSKWLEEIASGLVYLHGEEVNIAHGDLRGVNILIDSDWKVRLADFGLAVFVVVHLPNTISKVELDSGPSPGPSRRTATSSYFSSAAALLQSLSSLARRQPASAMLIPDFTVKAAQPSLVGDNTYWDTELSENPLGLANMHIRLDESEQLELQRPETPSLWEFSVVPPSPSPPMHRLTRDELHDYHDSPYEFLVELPSPPLDRQHRDELHEHLDSSDSSRNTAENQMHYYEEADQARPSRPRQPRNVHWLENTLLPPPNAIASSASMTRPINPVLSFTRDAPPQLANAYIETAPAYLFTSNRSHTAALPSSACR